MEVSSIAAYSKQPSAGASLEGTTTAQIAAEMSTNRNCTIEITNRLAVPLRDPQQYCSSGHCHFPPPPTVGPSLREAFAFTKASEALRGSVGVFTYQLGNTDVRLAVMFSVPYDYNLSSNWFAVGFVPASTGADDELYQAMYYSDEWADQPNRRRDKASSGRTLHIEYQNLQVDATMSDAKRAIIKIDLTSANVIQAREGGYGFNEGGDGNMNYDSDSPPSHYGGGHPHHGHHHHHHPPGAEAPAWNYYD